MNEITNIFKRLLKLFFRLRFFVLFERCARISYDKRKAGCECARLQQDWHIGTTREAINRVLNYCLKLTFLNGRSRLHLSTGCRNYQLFFVFFFFFAY